VTGIRKYHFLSIIVINGLLISTSILFQFCSKESDYKLYRDTLSITSLRDTGQLTITFRNDTYPDNNPVNCIITILDKRGDTIIWPSYLSLVENSNNFSIHPKNLLSGYYILTGCKVLDSKNNLLYTLVNQMDNAIEFKIEKDKLTQINPILNAVYIKPIAVDTFYIYAYGYNSILKKYNRTDASISLENNNSVFYSGTLKAETNALAIPIDKKYFIVNITKPLYKVYRDSILLTDLKLYKRIYPYTAFLIQ
jgi:hypothetical protein